MQLLFGRLRDKNSDNTLLMVTVWQLPRKRGEEIVGKRNKDICACPGVRCNLNCQSSWTRGDRHDNKLSLSSIALQHTHQRSARGVIGEGRGGERRERDL